MTLFKVKIKTLPMLKKKLALAALDLMHFSSHYRYSQTATYSSESCINSWCSSLCRMYVCETERTLRRFVDIIMLYDDIESPPPLNELQISEDGRLHSQQYKPLENI